MKCDIIIPIWNQPESTKSCIDHLIRNTLYPYKLILVDNGSKDKTKKYLNEIKKSYEEEIFLIENKDNLGFVKAVNQGLRVSKAPYVCILNNDTLPSKGWLSELINFAEKHPDIGLLNPLCSGHKEESLSINEYADKLLLNKDAHMEMNQCQGFCMLVKRELIDKIGYMDERFGIGGFDDTDYSMRAHRAGYRCVSVYSSYVYHSEHKSFDALGDRKSLQEKSEREYFKKWPRHLRIAILCSIKNDTSDTEIRNLLNSSLFLAKKWCWVNIFVLSDKNTKERLSTIKNNISFPLHQNLKFNYLNGIFKPFEAWARILERSFGRKIRKKYDIIFSSGKKSLFLLRFLSLAQKSKVYSLSLSENKLSEIVMSLRREKTSDSSMKCDIILPVYASYDIVKNCIENIIKNTDTPFRLIAINDREDEKIKSFLNKMKEDKDLDITIVHNSHNLGWIKCLNKGIDLSDAPYVCFQNDDTIVTQGWLRKMINILSLRDEFGMIGPESEGKPEGISAEQYNLDLEKNKDSFVETDWCRGFSVVVKRSVINKIGKVNEIYCPAYLDDVDYSVTAIESGFLCLKALNTYVCHHKNASYSKALNNKKWNELHERNKLIHHSIWGEPLKLVIILDEKTCNDEHKLDEVERTVFYLARKQHHIDLWSPKKFDDRFRHTNVKVKVKHPFLLKPSSNFDIYMNKKKRTEKRYSAVFETERINDFEKEVKEKADVLKEKTKEKVNAAL